MIQDLIDDLGLSDGETRRINCPHCSGFKTFTISILDGVAVWNCYKASCPSKGAAKQTLSKDAIVNRIVPLVKINRSKEITLTAKGSGLADNIAYRHNLAEYFLCNSLKIPWFEVHMHAHKLEHAMTPLVVEKLAEFLGQPQFCPHGTPMPGQSLPDNTLTLDHATVDTYVEIVMISEDLEDSLEIMQILQEKLIMPGYKHLVANISTALQSISLKQNNMETVLPMHVAKKIYAINVEEIT